MTPRQLLTRFSFSGLFQSEVLSESGVESYRAWIISVGVGLLLFHFHFARFLAKKYNAVAQRNDPALFQSVLAADELFYLSASFLMIALVAAIQWQSLFPGERDFLILSPLPLRRADIFLARITALALFLTIFLVTFNLPPALILPGVTRAPFFHEPLLPRMGAHLLSSLGASLHAFFSVLALQGLCLTALPYRWRSSASFWIQSLLLTAAIAAIPIVWHIPGLSRLLATRAEWISWLPTAWWLGVYECLRGSQDPWMHAMANRAIVAFSPSIAIGAATYFFLYHRFSDLASPPRPVSTRPSPLLFLARRADSGAFAFLAWTLARSPRHRLILSAIAAVGASFALDGFVTSLIRQWSRGREDHRLLTDTSLALPLLLAFSLTAALRMSFRIPHEWRAHWVFRLTEEAPSRSAQLEATVAAVYWLGILPAIGLALPFQLLTLGLAKTVAALPLLLGATACLVEYAFQDWRRLPFTATYSPANRPAAMTFVLFMTAFSVYGYGGAALIRALLANPLHWIVAAGLLAAAWLFLRRRRRSHWGHEPYDFIGDADPTVLVTGFAPE